MGGFLGEGRGHFGVPNGVRPFYGVHPRVSPEVASCSEAGDVPLEVVLVPAGLALGAVYEQSINLPIVSFKPLKKASNILKGSVAFFKDVRCLFRKRKDKNWTDARPP